MDSDRFSSLGPKIGALARERFKQPTPIQEAVMPEILRGSNVLVLSETGTGKTEAVLLPVWSMWAGEEQRQVSILYITPLKSLNRDLHKRIAWWSEKIGFEVSVRHGDTTTYERKMQSENPPDMLIVTPETLQALLTGKNMRNHLKNIKWVIVDEIHELVESKRGVQLSVALERLKELIKTSGILPQLIALSATTGSPEDVANFFSGSSGRCKIINTIKTKQLKLLVEHPKPVEDKKIDELKLTPEIFGRMERISQIAKESRSALIFTNTREFAEVLSSRIKALYPGLAIDTHHSSLSKDVRIGAEENFKNGLTKALIATSSLELGIDIGSIDVVLQYMSPRQVSKLLQRAGRSGHSLSRVSDGTIITTDTDDCLESAVIAKLALEQKIEKTRLYPKSLDVLAHQIIGMGIEGCDDTKKMYETAKKAHPFRNLSEKEFLNVCLLLQKLGFLWIDKKQAGPRAVKKKPAWEYYFENLSTIPDVKNYRIIDMISGKHIGTLDAEFVALHGFPGTSFICKGEAWRIVDILSPEHESRPSKILVEPASAADAAIPAWEGELIPVAYEIAQGVGMLRKSVCDEIKSGAEKISVIKSLAEKYPVSEDVAEKIYEFAKGQKGMPGEKDILIEHGSLDGEYWAVINCCFGSMVNETIGRALSALLTERIGAAGLQTDPYRIIFKLSAPNEWSDVVDVFRKLSPDTIDDILMLSIPKTELFSWRFLQVAKRFGIIKRGADFSKGYMRKIAELYKGSAAWDETFNEIFTEKLEAERAKSILKAVKDGDIKISVNEGLTPVSYNGIAYRFEVVAAERPEADIFNAFRERIYETKMRLICCHCGFAISCRIKNLPDTIECRSCKAKLVGVISPWDLESEEVIKRYVKRKPLNRAEEIILESVRDTASHVIGSGKNAVIAMAGRGIGPKTAGRILAKLLAGDSLLREILKAEKEYAKTRRYWK